MADGGLARVAISTGGGDCPGLNAVIRAFVKTADARYDWDVVGIEDGFDGLFRPDGIRDLNVHNVRGLLARGGTVLGTTNRGSPFMRKALVDGEIVMVDRSDVVIDRLKELHIGAVVMVGGDGSLRIGLGLKGLGVPIVGVPKTIDNDLSSTDVTFGFDTAVVTATDALDKLNSTAESHHRVMILEVMGRHAGWIALEAGLAGGAEVILIPEIPFRVEKIVEHIRERDQMGWHFSIIVVAEGARVVGGEATMLMSKDPLAPPRLGGVGAWLAEQLDQLTPHDVRATVLGHLQRGGSPSAFDRVLATRLGCAAAHAVGRGQFGTMVAVRGSDIIPVPLEDACMTLKLVPPDGDRVATARCLGVCFGD